jgi:hypothetical protein
MYTAALITLSVFGIVANGQHRSRRRRRVERIEAAFSRYE